MSRRVHPDASPHEGPGIEAGYVLEVSPQAGTMLNPGAVATVTVVAELVVGDRNWAYADGRRAGTRRADGKPVVLGNVTVIVGRPARAYSAELHERGTAAEEVARSRSGGVGGARC